MTNMTTLYDQKESLEQALLDIDSDSDRFWEIAAKISDIEIQMHNIRNETRGDHR